MPGFATAPGDNNMLVFPDEGQVRRVNLIDYIATMIVPVGAPERSPLFALWASPLVPRYEIGNEHRERVLSKVSDFSVSPVREWTWTIISVAASQPEAVIELTYGKRDYVFSGPWIREGFDLENPITVAAGLTLEGYLDRRRCGPGAINVWLRGFLYRK